MARVQLTANHRGYFQFKLCPAITRRREVSQACLDAHPLQVLDSPFAEETEFVVPSATAGVFEVRLQLPPAVSCARCVLQWTYTAGNNWGRCEDGSGRLGCGPQETYRGCADIKIRAAADFDGDAKATTEPMTSLGGDSQPRWSTTAPSASTEFTTKAIAQRKPLTTQGPRAWTVFAKKVFAKKKCSSNKRKKTLQVQRYSLP